jgi:hypothetical protein
MDRGWADYSFELVPLYYGLKSVDRWGLHLLGEDGVACIKIKKRLWNKILIESNPYHISSQPPSFLHLYPQTPHAITRPCMFPLLLPCPVILGIL